MTRARRQHSAFQSPRLGGPVCGRAGGAAAAFLARAGVRLRLWRRPRPRGRQAVRQGRQRPAGCGGAAAGAPVARQQQQPRLRPAALRRPPECLAGGPAPDAGRRQERRPGRALRPSGLSDAVPPVREHHRLGERAGGVLRHRRGGARHRHRRRRDLQGRRRPLPRHVVVPHGARRRQAIAQPDLRLREPAAAPARLQDAEPAERQRRPDHDARRALQRDRPALHRPRRRATTCGW